MNRVLFTALIAGGVLAATGLAVFALTTTAPTSAFDAPEAEPPAFATVCDERGGEVLEDTLNHPVTTTVTGTITGTVITTDGKVTTGSGTGSGVATAFVNITVRQCVVDGDVVDMEVVG